MNLNKLSFSQSTVVVRCEHLFVVKGKYSMNPNNLKPSITFISLNDIIKIHISGKCTR